MSDNSPETTPQSSVSQAVADELAVLAGELKAAEQKAASAWKTGAIIWAIVLAIIAGYLYLLVYARLLKPFAEPENLVASGLNVINSALESRGYANLDSSRLVDQIADKIAKETPGLVRDYIKPQVETFLADLPSRRTEIVRSITERAPKLMDAGVDKLETELLPRASDALLARVGEQVDLLMLQVDDELGGVVDDILVRIGGDLSTMGSAQMRGVMEDAFEEAMGPILDDMLTGLDAHVANVTVKFGDLVADQKAGRLEYRQKLEIRLIQLIRALFEDMDITAGGGFLEQVNALLKGEDLELTKPAQVQVRRGMQDPGTPIAEVDLSQVPAEAREEIRKAIERGRRLGGGAQQMSAEEYEAMQAAIRAAQTEAAKARGEAMGEAAARRQPTPEAGLEATAEGRRKAAEARAAAMAEDRPGGPPGELPADMPPDVRERVEEARKRAGAAAGAAGPQRGAQPPAGMPAEARKRMEEAKKKAAEAAAAARAAAGSEGSDDKEGSDEK